MLDVRSIRICPLHINFSHATKFKTLSELRFKESLTPAYTSTFITRKDIQTQLFLATAFRRCIEDKSKSDCRVKGPPPALRVRLQLRGHRQLDREDQTASLLSWCCVVTLALNTHTHTHTCTCAPTNLAIMRMKHTH